ncbi:MAG: DUF6616 family protein [Bacteroidota bacterium]
MIYFIEIWNATPAWHALSTEERADYMGQVGSHIQNLLDQGVKVLTWSNNDSATSHKAAYDYFAIWSFPTQELADGFQQLVEGAGWYNYFEQVNLMGKEDTAQGVIGQLIQL